MAKLARLTAAGDGRDSEFLGQVPGDTVITCLLGYRCGERVVGRQSDVFDVCEYEVGSFGLDVLYTQLIDQYL